MIDTFWKTFYFLAKLKDLKAPALQLVRVYSTKEEQLEFPIPRKLSLIKKSFKLTSKVQDSCLQSIALHHMIRDDRHNTQNAVWIRAMDQKIRADWKSITGEDIEEYRQAIVTAKENIMKAADILFVTCSGSGAPSFRSSTNVQQVNLIVLILSLVNLLS